MRHLQQLLEPLLGPVLVAQRVVAEHQVETGLEVGLLGHNPLEGGAGVRVLRHLDEENADVVHHLDAHALVRVGDLIQSHAVELDCLRVLPQLEVNVSHVDPESAGVGEHAVLGDDLVGVERLRVHLAGGVLVRQVEEDAEGEVQVVGLAESGLLPQADEAALLGGGLLGAVQCDLGVALARSQAGLVDQLSDL